ncbi:MAG: glycerophosphodiester phosphodiesterase [Thermosynechococcaceae cyanobacterium]
MLILSHRGYPAKAPENTLAAFEAAIALGVDGIETDIRLSRDNVPILYHDRLTPDGCPVATLTQAELSELVGYSVPRLEEALNLTIDPSKPFLWNLEIKTPDALNPTVAILSRYFAHQRILVTSFWHPLILELSQRVDVECGLLVAHRPIDFQVRPNWIPDHPSIQTLVYHYDTLDPALISQSLACGLRTFVYGAQTRQDHRQLTHWPIDGIITDHPEFLLRGRFHS